MKKIKRSSWIIVSCQNLEEKKKKSFYTSWELLGIVSETYSAYELDII